MKVWSFLRDTLLLLRNIFGIVFNILSTHGTGGDCNARFFCIKLSDVYFTVALLSLCTVKKFHLKLENIKNKHFKRPKLTFNRVLRMNNDDSL